MTAGGAGNWAVVLSVTVKLPSAVYWAAVEVLMQQVDALDVMLRLTRTGFSPNTATLPGATAANTTTALAPFHHALAQLNVSLPTDKTAQQPAFVAHYATNSSKTCASRQLPGAK
ncbi:hypothetical protein C7974DRAFT_456108 [Boeremia exigua]|uniref:uncharacterized protein n=1 Tax=Boeremia exigua TaxID=749465 RepID=UPI001E8CB889|nr:uncharacterized protein C7974DRAFT_456108 [Boeremia exigua]KAH6625803.1 hypothetical protein C7974DRAFT_456108 [Boeremia exigua]